MFVRSFVYIGSHLHHLSFLVSMFKMSFRMRLILGVFKLF